MLAAILRAQRSSPNSHKTAAICWAVAPFTKSDAACPSEVVEGRE